MKKMFIVKLTFVLAGLIFVYGYEQPNVAADEACSTTTSCYMFGGACWCDGVGCNGCFVASGSSGCGKCAKSGDLEIE